MSRVTSDDAELSTSPEDAELLTAHLAGDPDAFGILFRRHRDRLWAVALRTTGNPEDAADALQNALISAHRRADSFRGESQVTTWLHRIVVNASLDLLRRSKVRAADPLPDDLEETEAHGRLVEDTGTDPAEEAIGADRRTRILAALRQLPEDQRAVLVLVDMEGYSIQEAAEIVEVAPGTVKSRCSRGRRALADLLVSHGVTGPPPRSGGTTPTPAASHQQGGPTAPIPHAPGDAHG